MVFLFFFLFFFTLLAAVSVDSPAGRYQGEASFLLGTLRCGFVLPWVQPSSSHARQTVDRKQKILTHLRSKVKGMDQDEWLYRQPIGLPPIAK